MDRWKDKKDKELGALGSKNKIVIGMELTNVQQWNISAVAFFSPFVETSQWISVSLESINTYE